jgi:hypothetical protein
MWVTSQAGGNMVSSNEGAFSAPGSQPVDKLKDRDVQSDPHVELPAAAPPGTSGKPKARSQHGTPPGAPSWKPAGSPGVVRET